MKQRQNNCVSPLLGEDEHIFISMRVSCSFLKWKQDVCVLSLDENGTEVKDWNHVTQYPFDLPSTFAFIYSFSTTTA